MLGIFVLIGLGFLSWWALTPMRRFQNGFARLVDDARTHWGFDRWTFTTFVTGTYRSRAVTLQLFYPVGASEARSFSPGEVVLRMQVRAPESAAWKSSVATCNNPDLSRATFDLEGRYALQLSVREGSLMASWTSAPGRFFPGPFDEDRWRNTLAQMLIVAEWLERGTDPPPC